MRVYDGFGSVICPSASTTTTSTRSAANGEIDDDGLAASQASPAGEAAPPAGSDERTAFWGAPRAPMTLALSGDGGRTWPVRRNLEVGDGYCLTNNSRDGLNREFSYPSIQETADGALHIAFTYHRRVIKYVRIRPEWVTGARSL